MTAKKCKPCPRTPVNDVSGLYREKDCRRTAGVWLLVRHAPFARALYVLDVLIERAASGFVGRILVGGFAAGEFVGRDVHVNPVGFGVDRNRVAILDQPDRFATLRFGGDMSHDKAV